MWHEARKSEKKVHDMMDAARKRAQRRAIYLAKRRGDPHQSIQAVGSRCRIHRDDALYQATEDQQGLIPWNGKQDVLIDRFDGRALLDFIRDSSSRRFRVPEKTEEEEELEEFVNFERYRDLIKHRRRGFADEEGLQHVNQEIDAKITAAFGSERPHVAQPFPSKGSYSQVGFSYDGDGQDDIQDSDGEEDDDDDELEEEDFNSDDSNDEAMESIAKEFGVKRYGWLLYMDKKAKEEAKRQKEIIKGDPSIRKLSRKERRKASQIEREREREAARVTGTRLLHHDPYRDCRRSPTYEAYSRSRRSRSKSRSYSPSQSRRYSRGGHPDDTHRSKESGPKIEYITEFGSSGDGEDQKLQGYSPPTSPPQIDALNRPSSGHILEALHVDPASGVNLEKDRRAKLLKTTQSTSSALAKLSKATSTGSLSKQQGEKKETPQERLKRIMSKQLNKQSIIFLMLIFEVKHSIHYHPVFQNREHRNFPLVVHWLLCAACFMNINSSILLFAVKKDTAVEMAKKREQERQRLEKLAETSRVSRYQRRSRSRSDSRSPRRYRRSRSPRRDRSSRRYRSRSRSYSRSPHSRSPSRSPRSRSRSSRRSPSWSPRSRSRSSRRSPSRSPRSRSRSSRRSPSRSRSSQRSRSHSRSRSYSRSISPRGRRTRY